MRLLPAVSRLTKGVDSLPKLGDFPADIRELARLKILLRLLFGRHPIASMPDSMDTIKDQHLTFHIPHRIERAVSFGHSAADCLDDVGQQLGLFWV